MSEVKANDYLGLNSAIFNLKAELQPVVKGQANPFFKSNYADINEMLKVVEPLADKHGLIITQPLDTNGTANIVRTFITHVDSGSHVMSSITLPAGLTKPQDVGSAITYYRRYTLQSLLGLQTSDDDGNLASGKVKKATKKVSKQVIDSDF